MNQKLWMLLLENLDDPSLESVWAVGKIIFLILGNFLQWKQ